MTLVEAFIAWSGIGDDRARGLLQCWEFHAFERDGEPVAIAALKGSEIHFAISPAWRHRVIARQRTRDFLGPMFNRFGYLTTTAFGEDREDRCRFLKRLGFEPSWDEHDRRHFIMTELPFSREN